ncbi:unnamed protein product [Linum tenue]|uniref:Uncharacterized protein n=1 Tax=Linum tenue TaxID=586396 RepID=A0AAV0NM47_9ROSI|nr:unnamed protein product [Linum tenue]
MKEAELFWNFSLVEPGSGAFVSFWYDRWISNPSLAANFPRVAAVSTNLDARINDIVELSDLCGFLTRRQAFRSNPCTEH